MVLHNVSMKWKDDVGPEQIAAVSAALDRLAALAEVESLLHGENLGLNPATAASCDYAFSVRLEGPAAFRAYLAHPAHAELGELLAPLIAERMSAQIAGEHAAA